MACVLVGVLAGGCGRGHSGSAAAPGCRPPLQEALDPHSTEHLFPGAAEPAYLTNPPTSGPHRLGPPPTGVVAAPISRPVQVAMLELGYVIIQYRAGAAGAAPVADAAGGAGAAALAAAAGAPPALAALAGDRVTVAPGLSAPALPAPIVATAWTWKMECGTADATALAAFIAAHRGKGFSHSLGPQVTSGP